MRGAKTERKRWLARKEEIISRSGVHLITRWRVNTPWGNVFLHKIRNPDQDRDMHDHPWPFVSVVLRGGYAERIPMEGLTRRGPRIWNTGSVHFMAATQFHRIVAVLPHTWTLILTRPVCRQWGFRTTKGWVSYQDYFA